MRPTAVKLINGAVLMAGLNLLADATPHLATLSSSLPVLFDWLGPVLRWLGLLK